MSKMLDVQIEVPDSVPEDVLQFAGAREKESAIVALQQRGELTISKAAAPQGLTYEEYRRVLPEMRCGPRLPHRFRVGCNRLADEHAVMARHSGRTVLPGNALPADS